VERVRTTIAVHGFTAAEAAEGLPPLRQELAERGLLGEVRWDGKSGRLLVTVESESFGPRTAAGHEDEVWDCVIACIRFSGEGIRFEQV
jgi:hypothetical protein